MVACKPNFLLSVRALSNTFRRLFLDGLEAAFRRSELGFFGDLVPLTEATAFAKRVRALRQSAFVVYAKPPFGGPERVLAYLARYTHRTAIANSRLVAVDDD
jgi:Putative transposase